MFIARSMLKWSVLMPLMLAGCLLSAAALAQTLTVEGKGTVEIAPEFARMSAGVSLVAETAAEAQVAVDRVMSQLLAGLDDLPIAKDSVNAGQIRIQPRYRWNPRAETQEFQGYEATRKLTFRLTSIESLGEALQMLSERGATMVDEPQYGSTQTETARNRALAMAYSSARIDAETLAAAAGLTLGPPENISTGIHSAPVFRAMNRDVATAMAAEMTPAYEAGQLVISATVSVIFTATP
ncbi:MAG: SIMPL domain-containing protein [Luminiphilus sp.]